MGRWEAPLPTSPSCNARCLGCLSRQPPDSCCPATQDRITFTPTVDEILEIAVPHLEAAPRAVASFGQGCEGEPLLVAPLIEAAVRAIRARTARGTLNLNTNASRPAALERILDAGLDSVRVSLNSARPELYRAYARPQGYGFEDVVESMRAVRRRGKFLSINYFVFPGVTDDPAEWAAFRKLLREVRPDLIQWRNLNLDPAWYWRDGAAVQGRRAAGRGGDPRAGAPRIPGDPLRVFQPARARVPAVRGRRRAMIKHLGRKLYHVLGGLGLLAVWFALGRPRAFYAYAALLAAVLLFDVARFFAAPFQRLGDGEPPRLPASRRGAQAQRDPALHLRRRADAPALSRTGRGRRDPLPRVGDVSATTVGERWGRHKVGAKSLEGTAAFFAAACLAGFAARVFLHGPAPGAIVAGAWCAALVELFLPRFANDNLVIPLVAAFAMTILAP